MNQPKGKTWYEDGKYYAVIMLPGGYEYYSGPKNSRSSAYRYSVMMTRRHFRAAQNNMTYNTKGL